jgi:cell division protein FtsI (penicillin-binding protein 3)
MKRGSARFSGNRRHAALAVAFLLAFLAVAVRLVWIQVVKAPAYAEEATSQRLRDIEISPRRGTIYDREGEPLAVSVEARTVYASPRHIEDLEGVVDALTAALGGSEEHYRELLTTDKGFVYIERKVDLARSQDLEEELRTRGLKGIGFQDDFRRMYPSGELAAQTLGFVDPDGKGIAGIESYYDELLAGVPGVVFGELDPTGRPIPGGIQKVIEPQHGQDVVLTIDKDIQYEAQVEIARAVRKWGARSGSVVVMSPKSGEIYAVATAPGFNPNEYGKAKSQRIRNKPLTDAYEPGSTLKCLTAAAAIEEGIYSPDSMFDLPPTIKVGGRVIKEAHPRPSVRWSLTQIVTNSSNVGTVKVGMKLGAKGLYRSFVDFGLTETPGTDFPGTTKGWLPPTEQWSATSIGNIPFGQGVSVTPMQLARAIGSLANGGVLVTPHLLMRVPDSPETDLTWPSRRAVGKDTAAKVTTMLEEVITDGTGAEAAVEGYRVAGKTGTAQKARADGRGYQGGGYVGSFIGYLPAEDPEVLVYVLLDQPTNAIYGGVVAGPSFSRIAGFSVSHLKIPPSSPNTETLAPRVGQVSDGDGAE